MEEKDPPFLEDEEDTGDEPPKEDFKAILTQPTPFYFYSPNKVFAGGTRVLGTMNCSPDLKTLTWIRESRVSGKIKRTKTISTADIVASCSGLYIPATGEITKLDENLYRLFSII